MRVFLARDLTAVGQDLEDDESIEVREMPLVDVAAMIVDGTVRDGKTIAGLYMWELWLRQQDLPDGAAGAGDGGASSS